MRSDVSITDSGDPFLSPKEHCMPKFRMLFVTCLVGITLTAVVQAEQTGLKRKLLAADEGKRIAAIVDGEGQVVWQCKAGPIHDAQVLDNGNVLLALNYQTIAEVDRLGQTVWKYDAKSNGNANRPVEVHAFQRLANGRTMIVESGPGRIIEVDRDGVVQHEIKMKVSQPHPHRDTRLARKLDSGNYLVAHEGDGVVREYDAKGVVVWEFEVPLFGKQPKGGHGPEGFGNSVFAAYRLTNGNTLIATGNGHSVLEVTPQKEIVWKLEQNDLPGITLAWVTTLQPLSNGNVIIGNCHAGEQNPQLVEVTRDKKVVWTFRDFKIFGNSTPVATVLGEDGKPLK